MANIDTLVERLVKFTTSEGASSPFGRDYALMAVGKHADKAAEHVQKLLSLSDVEFDMFACGRDDSTSEATELSDFVDDCTADSWQCGILRILT